MSGHIKTVFLLILLSGLILFLGRAMGGSTGLYIAGGIALLMNVGSYWYSDKIVLSAYRAKEVSPSEAPGLHRMVEELAKAAGIPKPRVCLIPEAAPNAFATGRNPEHAVVAVTEGLLRLMSPEELRGVLAQEIGHVVNRDILIQSLTGVLASVVMFVANMLQWGAIFGMGRSSNDNNGGGGAAGALLLALLAPIAASLIQFAISRSREFIADETGARLAGSPQGLASALLKLTAYAKQAPMRHGGPATAHLFIVNPFAGGIAGLFSTHPPVEERVRRLQEMR